MIFRVPEIFYYGRYPFTVNPVEYFSLQSYLLKEKYRRSPLVPFSSLFVLVGDYFYLGLSLSPTIVWRAQSGCHTPSLGRILLRDSFFVEGGYKAMDRIRPCGWTCTCDTEKFVFRHDLIGWWSGFPRLSMILWPQTCGCDTHWNVEHNSGLLKYMLTCHFFDTLEQLPKDFEAVWHFKILRQRSIIQKNCWREKL